jgi:ComF family protein
MVYKILQKFLNFIYPPLCVFCKKLIEDENAFLCVECWSKLKFIQEPCCNICSTPLKYKISENDICASCIKQIPLYNKAKAVFVYNDAIAKLIYKFKYYDNTHLSDFFAKIMVKRAGDILNKIDIIIPTPLHKKRLEIRKYNQSGLLATKISKLSKKQCVVDLLQRKKHVAPQVKLKGERRITNLKSVFQINPKYVDKKKNLCYTNKSYLLIDDVMTTGTTINECVKILLRKGAKSVYALTIAKTVLRD